MEDCVGKNTRDTFSVFRIRTGSGFIQVSGSFPDRKRNPDQDPGGQKKDPKNRKKFRNFMFLKEPDVLFWGMKASSAVWTSFMEAYVVIFDPKNIKKIFSCKFFLIFVIKTLDPYWIRIDIQPKMLDPDLFPDPQHWIHTYGMYKFIQHIRICRISLIWNWLCIMCSYENICGGHRWGGGGERGVGGGGKGSDDTDGPTAWYGYCLKAGRQNMQIFIRQQPHKPARSAPFHRPVEVRGQKKIRD